MENEIIEVIRVRDSITVSWKMTDWCNYRCPYCRSDTNNYKFIDETIIIERAKKLNSLIDLLTDKVTLVLVGGEVTYYNLSNIIKNHFTSKNICQINIVSNLSNSLEYYLSLNETCKSKNIKLLLLVASVHLTEIKNIDEFVNKAEKLGCHLNIVLTENNYANVKNFLELIANNISISSVNLLFDKNKNINIEAINNVYEFYKDNFLNIENTKHERNYEVVFKDNQIKNYTRSELRYFDYNFKGYNCLGSIRMDINGDIVTGPCFTHKNIKFNIDEIINLNSKEINNKLIAKCNQNICTLCNISHIWK